MTYPQKSEAFGGMSKTVYLLIMYFSFLKKLFL